MGLGDIGATDDGHGGGRHARRLFVILTSLALTLATPGLAVAGNLRQAPTDAEVETHCVLDVLDVLLDGEFVVGEPICFPTFEEAMTFVGLAGLDTGSSLIKAKPDLTKKTSRARAAEPSNGTNAYSSSYVIGIHFKNRNGGGSSVTLTGTSCSGGYWNASSSWRNVISSSYNGCAHLKHFSELYVSGTRYDTWTAGQTDNIYGSMDNSTKSISYHSS